LSGNESSNTILMKDNKIIRELCLSYAIELETVQNYIAASVNLDGVRSEVIKKALAADVAVEVQHAQQLAARITNRTTVMNKSHSPELLSPFNLHGLELRNRVVMAPLTRARAGRERVPNDLMAEYYTQRASAGLIITEATVISEQGFGWVDSPGIYYDSQVAGWKKTTAALHSKGTPVFLQLWHCGRASHGSFHGGKPAVSASAIKLNGDYIHTRME